MRMKRIAYILAILVFFAIGILAFLHFEGRSEEKEFALHGQSGASFEFNSSISSPKRAEIRLKGEAGCDGFLLLKGVGTNVKVRRTFPVKKGEQKGIKWEFPWNTPEIELEYTSRECEDNNLKIIVAVFEK